MGKTTNRAHWQQSSAHHTRRVVGSAGVLSDDGVAPPDSSWYFAGTGQDGVRYGA